MSPGCGRLCRVSPSDDRSEVSALSYEQAKEELVEVVRRLETGSASLEESLALWERGEALAAHCQEWLDGARRRLDSAHSAVAPEETAAGTETPADREAALDDAAAGVPEEDER
ncbi:exodeoxyribonuclease VII small subunit [Georgenia muralis]|nr:exodeoxyribonuclease VII small subunit [Georgenia muralis]